MCYFAVCVVSCCVVFRFSCVVFGLGYMVFRLGCGVFEVCFWALIVMTVLHD